MGSGTLGDETSPIGIFTEIIKDGVKQKAIIMKQKMVRYFALKMTASQVLFGWRIVSRRMWQEAGIKIAIDVAIFIKIVATAGVFACRINQLLESQSATIIEIARYCWLTVRLLFVKNTLIPRVIFVRYTKIKNISNRLMFVG
jgi:hypothetical protein